jgi:hypothetical protein
MLISQIVNLVLKDRPDSVVVIVALYIHVVASEITHRGCDDANHSRENRVSVEFSGIFIKHLISLFTYRPWSYQ